MSEFIHHTIHNAALTEAHTKAHTYATMFANKEGYECRPVYISMYLKIYTQEFEKIYTETRSILTYHIKPSE